MEELIRLAKENNELLKDNNRMLKEIINFINIYLSHMQNESQRDFERNLIADLIGSLITGK